MGAASDYDKGTAGVGNDSYRGSYVKAFKPSTKFGQTEDEQVDKGIFHVTPVQMDLSGKESSNDETKGSQNIELLNYIGPVAMYKKNAERDYWQNEPLNELFAGDRVFTKMENNSTSVGWNNGRYTMEQSSLSGGALLNMNEDDEESKKNTGLSDIWCKVEF